LFLYNIYYRRQIARFLKLPLPIDKIKIYINGNMQHVCQCYTHDTLQHIGKEIERICKIDRHELWFYDNTNNNQLSNETTVGSLQSYYNQSTTTFSVWLNVKQRLPNGRFRKIWGPKYNNDNPIHL